MVPLAAEAFFSEKPSEEAMLWFRRPRPPVALGVALAEAGVHAMMDLSDGLQKDLRRLCVASHCGALIFSEKIPGISRLDWAVSFGEDYELLFCAPSSLRDAIVSLCANHHRSPCRIGTVTAETVVELVGQPWPGSLFDHFPEVFPVTR